MKKYLTADACSIQESTTALQCLRHLMCQEGVLWGLIVPKSIFLKYIGIQPEHNPLKVYMYAATLTVSKFLEALNVTIVYQPPLQKTLTFV